MNVSVIGGSIVGLACAYRLASAGCDVTLYAPEMPGTDGAGWVAGGMLGAYSEAWPGEEDMLFLGVAALDSWMHMGSELGGEMFTAEGSLLTAVDEADAAELATIREFVAGYYPDAFRTVTRRELRVLEPSLRRGLRGGIVCDEELAVDNRLAMTALARGCNQFGVKWVRTIVEDVSQVSGERVVVAAGAGSEKLIGLPMREVKGEVLRLRRRASSQEPPRRTIRAKVHGRAVYLVPRDWGLAVGATEYEHGHDLEPTAGGVRQLLDDAALIFPGIDDYAFDEVVAGLRPYSPDNKPYIGAVDDRIIAACGHGRNGILLSALTADAVLAEIAGERLPIMRLTDPHRFEKVEQ